jgi:hypothetical protein
MQSLLDLLAVYSELAIGLAGFSGVAAAFSGRDRKFKPTELARLQTVLMSSASVVLGSLSFYVASTIGADPSTPTIAAAVTSLTCTLYYAFTVLPRAWRALSDPDSTSNKAVLTIFTAITVAILLAYAGCVLLRGLSTLLVAGFSMQLAYGLWSFTRLLTRPN